MFVAAALGVPALVGEACSSSPGPPTGGTGDDAGTARDTSVPKTDTGQGTPDTSVPPDSDDDALADASTSDAADAAPVDAGPDTAPVCNPAASLGADAGFVLGTPDPDLMGGISDDQLVIAWTSLADGGPVVHWAERAASTDVFGATQTLDPALGAPAPDHVALRGDGLRLVFASADRTQIYELDRTARGAPFTTNEPNEDFPGVNPHTEGTNTDPGYGPFGSPSLGSSFKTMWAFINGNAGFVVSENSLGVWSGPTFPPSLAPLMTDRYVTTPTGWSIDGRTLFFWDNGTGLEQAVWRDYSSVTFGSTVVSLGAEAQYAVPSSDCTSVYFSQPGAGGDLDVFVAPFQ